MYNSWNLNAPKKILIIEEALKNKNGHWLEYTQSVVDILTEKNFSVAVATHIEIQPGILKAGEIYPIFSKSAWDGIYKGWFGLKELFYIIKHNWTYFRKVKTLLKKKDWDFDYIFCPTISPYYHLPAWALLFLSNRKPTKLFLLIRTDISKKNKKIKTTGKLRPLFVKLWLSLLKGKILKGTISLFTDSTRLASSFKELTGFNFSVLPIPHLRKLIVLENREARNAINFVSLGSPRFEKGADLLLSAIIEFIENHNQRNVKFILQLNNPLGLDRSFDEKVNFLKTCPQVELIEHALDQKEYDFLISQSDVIVLPYRSQFYYNRTSGIAVEAMAAGIPIIYTKETWIEEFVNKHGVGLGIQNENVKELTTAFYTLSKNLPQLKEAALKKAAEIQKSNSKDAFFDSLFKGSHL